MRGNLLNAGDFVEPIPNGIPLTLQYDGDGRFEKVIIGFETDSTQESSELYSYMLKRQMVPLSVYSNKGTCFVRGVLYTGKKYKYVGKVPNAQINNMLEDLLNGKIGFTFFAGSMFSTSIQFTGVNQVRTWLNSQKFKLLPGYIVTTDSFESRLSKLMDNDPFEYLHIIGYFIFRGDKSIIEMFDNTLDLIDNISTDIDNNGYLVSTIHTILDRDLKVSYKTVIDFNLSVSDYILIEGQKIIDNLTNEITVSNSHKCEYCGKIYSVVNDFTTCPNDHCLSHLYNDLSRFIKATGLLEISFEEYKKIVKDGKFTKFSDVFLLDDNKDYILDISMYEFLDAVISQSKVRDRNTIWKLYSCCDGSWDNIFYYIYHPFELYNDFYRAFNSQNLQDRQLIDWLSDPYNADKINETLMYSNINITSECKKFNGSPIFRGKRFYITGKFAHGSYAEMSSILNSYDGVVTDKIEDADIGLVGDIPEDVNGVNINILKSMNIPIFNETQLFNQYDLMSE